MLKIKSATGCVHAVDDKQMGGIRFRKGEKKRRATMCNHANYYYSYGEQYYHDWPLTDDEVTCQRCIAVMVRQGVIPDVAPVIELGITSLGKAIVKADKQFKAHFIVLSKQCPFRKPATVGRKKIPMFKCTHKNLKDPNFGWSCGMGNCPHMNRAMDWRANNIE